MMAALIAKYGVKPVSVFADKLSLCTQIKEEFEKFLGIPVGLVGGGTSQTEDITVYSVQSVTEDMIKDTKMIMFDECLTGDTMVTLYDGTKKTIEEIVDNKLKCNVITYNTVRKVFEVNKVYNWQRIPFESKNKRMVELLVEDGKEEYVIKCTEDHKIWVDCENSYIEAGKLIIGMKLVCKNLSIGEIKSLKFSDPVDYVYDISVENNHNFLANDVVVSNCHHVPSQTANQIAKWAKNAYYRIGVSATPWRDAGDDLLIEAVLKKRKLENSINASKLIGLGYLVKPTIYFVPIKQVFKGKNYHKLYTEAIVNNKERNDAIVKIALKMKETRNCSTLILIQRVEHGKNIQDMIFKKLKMESKSITVTNPKNGKDVLVRVKNVEFLSGQDDAIRRKAVLQSVKDGFTSILIGSTIADEGMDVPRLDCLILGSGGKSSTRAFQRIGRVIRLFKDPVTGKEKEKAIVFDFQDYTPTLRRHSRVREKLYLTEEAWDIKYFNPNLLKD